VSDLRKSDGFVDVEESIHQDVQDQIRVLETQVEQLAGSTKRVETMKVELESLRIEKEKVREEAQGMSSC
jgi:uncharacterized protein (DUF3084 family)